MFEKDDSEPTGICKATHERPNSLTILSIAARKVTFSRSILLTNIIFGSDCSSAIFHICLVPTSTPDEASIIIKADSATLIEEITSPL